MHSSKIYRKLCTIVIASLMVAALPVYAESTVADEVATSSISATTYSNLIRFARFCAATYIGSDSGFGTCTTVKASMITDEFYHSKSNSYGYLAVDTAKKQIVVAFRGTQFTVPSIITDANILLSAYSDTPGCTFAGVTTCYVHAGFYNAWQALRANVTKAVNAQLAAYPTFTVIVTGHSYGGALATFAALRLLADGKNVYEYSYGSPRVGTGYWAANYNNQMAGRSFRGTRVNDDIPHAPPAPFEQLQTEYYQQNDIATQSTVVSCVGDEDSACNWCHGHIGYNETAHLSYFGVAVGGAATSC